METGTKRVSGREDASIADASEFPLIAEQRPLLHFVGVEINTRNVDPHFHSFNRSSAPGKRPKVRAIEILDQVVEDDEDSLFVYYEDDVIRKVKTRPFITQHRTLMDSFLNKRAKGELLPFDRTEPYQHPAGTARKPQKLKISRRQLDSLGNTSESSSAPDNLYIDVDDEEEDDDNESAKEESSSEPYDEEGDESEPVRRSTRHQRPQKQTKLTFEPRETRAFRSTRRHRAPETSESEGDEDLDDSDVQIIEKPSRIQPKRNQQAKTASKANDKADDALQAPKKPVQRKPRTINQDLGTIRPAEDDDYPNLFERHRPDCGVCSLFPVHLVIQQKKKAPKKGGWIKCIQCTEAVHWACLQPRAQDEILRAVKAQRQSTDSEDMDESDEDTTERNEIKYFETTDFLCAYCTQKGACFECKKPLEKPNGATTTANDTPPNVDTVMVPAEKALNEATGQATVNDSARPASEGATELWFRCTRCHRAAHYAHLKSPWIEDEKRELDSIEEIAEYYQDQWDWLCDDCTSLGGRAVDKILAWRPFPSDAPIESADVIVKKMKDAWPREYLVKWEGMSYCRLNWAPHSWMSSRAYQKLRHFTVHGSRVKLEHLGNAGLSEKEQELARRRLYEEEDGPPLPNVQAEECVPDSWKIVDQVLDVRFLTPTTLQKIQGKGNKEPQRKQFQLPDSESDDVVEISNDDANGEGSKEDAQLLPNLQKAILAVGVDLLEHADASKIETPLKRKKRGEAISEADIDDVIACYVKWGDLEYQEATWDIPPKRGDQGWDAWEKAFSGFIRAQSVFVAKTTAAELEERDSRDPKKFARNNMKISKSFVHDKGMQLRPFQLDGVNWLLYQWWRLHPAILADEMGLGKTVQIITFLAKLVEKKIWPHLVVVPNSTILNWMREFQAWAPNVRAVAYYGEQSSRKIIRAHEIFHSSTSTGQTKLKLHVLVTTYETFLTQEEWATVFKAPSRWEVLIVDEGQRLKNNNSMLFQRLNNINIGHRVLMTGTPLNNNIRELLNLMNFVDPKEWSDLKALEREYHQDTLTPELVAELHEKLKEYFLRRTKEILNLPGKHEIIVPISLSKLQKSVYKSLIESNLSLLSGLINGASSRANAKVPKTNLRNILMQTRKCCQHPYLVEDNLEVRTLSPEETHRQLIDASGKLKFLKIMLAKLKARGRRVLLFSQFVIALNIIEDFIVGEGYKFLRLDGDLKSSLRQKDIDKYNAPGSDYFIYLLSTRAGGVGINLATADTVIIFDPDFNPHQDAQAIARSHRFGQKKDVIVFRMLAKLSPEEKIMAAGKKKLLLDHVIVQNMEDEEPIEDLTSMLLSGAKHLFDGQDENDIVYTEGMIESLIDDAEVEAAKAKDEKTESAGLTFEFAQIWENTNQAGDNEEANDVDVDFWAQMIAKAQEEKEKAAAQEVAASGRGAQRKAKAIVTTYQQLFEDSPEKKSKHKKSKSQDSDKEYTFKGAESSPSPSEAEIEAAVDILGDLGDLSLGNPHGPSARQTLGPQAHSQVKKREPVCALCDFRHGEKGCTAIQTLEGSRRLRLLLLAGNDSPEDKEQALWYLDEHIAELEAEEAKRNALIRQAALQQARLQQQTASRNQSAANPHWGHSNSSYAMASGSPHTNHTSHAPHVSVPSSSLSSAKVLAPAGISRSNSNVDVSTTVKKRPLDNSSDSSRPFKKANTGVRPQFCVLCTLPFHPVVECKLMNSDAITMQRRLQQLEAQLMNPEAAPYINALRGQYDKKVKQATRPR